MDNVEISSPLDSIIELIDNETRGMNEIAEKLRAHADRLYGPFPRQEEETPKTVRSGRLGVLEEALENLRNANSHVAYEAGRNTTFA